MRSAVITIVLLLGLLTGASLRAEEVSGKFYYKRCKAISSGEPSTNVSDGIMKGDCLGVFKTIIYFNTDIESGRDIFYCAPRGVTVGQLTRVSIAFMDRNPALMHEPFAHLALMALAEAWPCKKN
jgi:hypothetical protein